MIITEHNVHVKNMVSDEKMWTIKLESTEGTSLPWQDYVAFEEKPFYSMLSEGAKLTFKRSSSLKFGLCMCITEVEYSDGRTEQIEERRILIHGSNENGLVTAANSANCLIPVKEGFLEEIYQKGESRLGVSKAETRELVKQMPEKFTTIIHLKKL